MRSLVVALSSVLAACALHDAAAASARAPVSFGAATFLGSGCRPADVAVASAMDGDASGRLSVTFLKAFAVESNVARKRVACNGVIPVSVEEGKAVGIAQKRIAGVVDLPEQAGASAQLTTEFFFSGKQGPTTQKRFDAAGRHPFALDEETAIAWSPCGSSPALRINTALVAAGPRAHITLVSADEQPAMEFIFHVRDCQAPSPVDSDL
ncbi:hypothetical protein P43SY_006487 [Pythium insidiosum]|uniref:DUF4360 domain-containing protein n=1 Tax=Pythium insidiosum TaxID=114742 RepID=A0AAD5LZL3_PYTIN|nr:hypothetical protein P43SY_006487 [Pythium insidiosum]